MEQQEYKTFAFNCHSPHSIQYIDKEERCNSQTNTFNTAKPNDWDILVHPLKQSYKESWCSIVRSTTKIRCGLWSYNQLLAAPETEVNVHVSSSDCQSMIQEGVYRTPEGTEIKLDSTCENVISLTLGGEMHPETDKTNYCQGSDRRIGDGVIENTLILEQLKINILSTNILAEANHRLISDLDMAYLPSQCKAHHNFCFA